MLDAASSLKLWPVILQIYYLLPFVPLLKERARDNL